jgi:hypothetical protein
MGILWVEDIVNSPGTYTQIGTVTMSSYAKMCTAFGRKYIAPSDGLHGKDIPLQWDGTFLDRVTQDGPGAPPTCASVPGLPAPGYALGTGASPLSLQRISNVVTVNTATPHGLQVGYQAQLTDFSAEAVGFVSTITIDNESLPGIASVEMATPHGLSPGCFATITQVSSVVVGGLIAYADREGQIVTITTTAAHGLTPGASVTLTGLGTPAPSTASSFNVTATVTAVPSPTEFVFIQAGADGHVVGAGSPIVLINWPIPDTLTPTYYEVLACPSTTNFQVQLAFSDGVWTTGAVYTDWNSTVYVTNVISTTSFQYKQNGPDGSSSDAGQVTPFGQAAPGLRQCQVLFLTRQGYLTRPSPPALFTTNGGQYVSVTNIPIGPSNVVARIIAFTGALGSLFYYIPTPAQENGQVVSTATQINDNTTTSITLDFSDNTLYGATGISIPGNTPVNQIILDGALGFGFYASRLITWGQRNRIQNLLNMGFDGGWLSSATTFPLGWSGGTGGSLAPGRWMQGWTTSATALTQSFYQDAYGAPIATPNTPYTFRAYLGSAGNVMAKISSASTSFSSTVTLTAALSGGWYEGAFSTPMPAAIPADMILGITGNGVVVDELSIIYAQNPYLETILYGSYVDNPEAFDGLSGQFGASQDTQKVMAFSVLRQTMNFLTIDPGGRLHQTQDNGVTEPSGWSVNEIAAECGLLSAFGLTQSQADDSSAAGGEEWFAWASSSGARIFGGDQPYKISQEIQPSWDAILPAFNTTVWSLNDPVGRVMYFGLPIAGAAQGSPNIVYSMSYRQLDTAYQIATSSPIHVSFSGKLIASDHTRKWAPWRLPIAGAALMYRQAGALSPVFFNGNGSALGFFAGYGNVYTLNAAKFSDDDYGQIFPYYTTYFFVNHDQEQGLTCIAADGKTKVQLGGGRKLLAFVSAFITSNGASNTQIQISFLPDALAYSGIVSTTGTLVSVVSGDNFPPWFIAGWQLTLNGVVYTVASQTSPTALVLTSSAGSSLAVPWSSPTWPLTVTRTLVTNPKFDLECGGGSAIGQRIAIRFAAFPIPATMPTIGSGFNLQKVVAFIKRAERAQVRGAA